MRIPVIFITLLTLSHPALAEETAPTGQDDAKTLSGMSVLGNNEAPKSLVLVPWKSSQIGDGIGVVESLNNRPMPIDRDVFSRELTYYHLRIGSPVASGLDGRDLKLEEN